MSNTDPPKTVGEPQVLAKDNQFLSLIRNPPCYSYVRDEFDTTMNKQAQIA